MDLWFRLDLQSLLRLVVGGKDDDDSNGLTWTKGGVCYLEVAVLSNRIRLRFKI